MNGQLRAVSCMAMVFMIIIYSVGILFAVGVCYMFWQTTDSIGIKALLLLLPPGALAGIFIDARVRIRDIKAIWKAPKK